MARSLSEKPLVLLILEDYLTKADLRDLLRDLSDDVSGYNSDLVRRLLRNKWFDRKASLQLLGKPELTDLCKLKGKDPTGNPRELSARLAEVLDAEERPPRQGRSRAESGPELWAILHPSVQEHARARFEAGQYADSVFAAMRAVSTRVRNIVRARFEKELDGVDLMNHAFSPKSPLIILASLDTQSGRDEQLGYMELFAGAMLAIRNPKAHDSVKLDEGRAIHHLFLASLLLFKLDEAGVP